MLVELIDVEGQLLGEIADSRMKRDDVALTYAFGLRQGGVDWPKVNRAIIDRWSMAALKYIKESAWKRGRFTTPLMVLQRGSHGVDH